MSNDALRAPLVELVEATSKAGIRLFLAGGYGLYLAVLHDLLLTGASGPVGSLLSSRSAEAPPEQVAPRRPV